jgi:thiol:disulfide interchange protein
MTFAEALIYGAVGGLVLNVMPCVLPVLMFKVQRLIEHSDENASVRRKDALAFLLGTLVTFAVFAVVIIVLRGAGSRLGWGMQMQNPVFVAAMTTFLFAFGLNSLGVFEINISIGGGRSGSGALSSFVDGALITLVATPCSAPFLGGAATVALAKSTAWYETLLLFEAIGVGLALPIVLIGFVPAFNRWMPRPGAWMNTFKELVGLTLMGATVWLFATLQEQLTPTAANDFLWFLVVLAVALWGKERFAPLHAAGRRRAVVTGLSVLLILAGAHSLVHFDRQPAVVSKADYDALKAAQRNGPAAAMDLEGKDCLKRTVKTTAKAYAWVPYNAACIAAAHAAGRTVFLDFTAKWCASCKLFEKTILNTDEMRQAFVDAEVVSMIVDMTVERDEDWDLLDTFGRSAIPVYVLLHPDGRREVLPEGAPVSLLGRLEATLAKRTATRP